MFFISAVLAESAKRERERERKKYSLYCYYIISILGNGYIFIKKNLYILYAKCCTAHTYVIV